MKIFLISALEETPIAVAQLEAAFRLDLRTMRHETAGRELTRTALDVELRSAEITPEVAAHVLHHFGERGMEPGGDVGDLIPLIARADPARRRRLALAEPAYVLAVALAQDSLDGAAMLQAIAAGGTAAAR